VIGGLAVSVVVTVFLVPAVYLMVHGKDKEDKKNEKEEQPA
jgi:Cu/Ag efflux pump CusA